MPTLLFTTLDVFTRTRFTGNPLAIVLIPPDKDISTKHMQTIAAEFNLSETLFLYPRSNNAASSSIPEWHVRIFTVNREVPFAGHPTIGAACYALGTLAQGAPQGVLICNAGRIELRYASGVATALIPHRFHRHVDVPFTPEAVHALQPSLRESGIEPLAIDVLSAVDGMNFVCMELPSLAALALVRTTGVKAEPRLDGGWTTGFAGTVWYVVLERDLEKGKAKVQTRMIESLLEDAATGSAACALTMGLALKWRGGRRTGFEIVQGVEMGRRSEIGVVVTLAGGLDVVETVELSGSAVEVMRGEGEFEEV